MNQSNERPPDDVSGLGFGVTRAVHEVRERLALCLASHAMSAKCGDHMAAAISWIQVNTLREVLEVLEALERRGREGGDSGQ